METARKQRWSSFVHPGCRIPPVITQLTGITDAMVADAPGIKDLLPQIREFVGRCGSARA